MNGGSNLTPAFLAAPSLVVYAGALLLPLGGVLLLSLHGFDFEKGILPGWGLENYRDLLTDSLFAESLLRTLRIALWTTAICLLVGVPRSLDHLPHGATLGAVRCC